MSKIIYATPFNASDKQATGPSTDSGFTSIDAVVAIMGDPDIYRSKRMAIYGPGEERVVFSTFVFYVDGGGNTG